MKTYFQFYYYSMLTMFAYPSELLFTLIEPVLSIGFLALFWSMFAQYSLKPVVLSSIVAYFIIAKCISIWAMNPTGLSFSRYLGGIIKSGAISQTMVRPVRILPAVVFEYNGYWGVDAIYSVFLFAIAIKMIGEVALLQFVWFVVFVALSYIISLSLSILIGSIGFYATEINGIGHSVSHLIRILSGAWVPLAFFSEKTLEILKFTPFPTIIYIPINILQSRTALETVYRDFFIGAIWAGGLLIVALYIWKRSMKKYEAVGI